MFSFRTKLISFMSALIIIISALSCLFFLNHFKRQQIEGLEKLGTSLVMLLAQDSEVKHALTYTQSAFLDAPIKRIQSLDREEEIGYYRISNIRSVMAEEKARWLNIEMKEIPARNCQDQDVLSTAQARWARGGVDMLESSMDTKELLTDHIIIPPGNEFYDFSVPVMEKQTFSEEEFAAQILGENEVPREGKRQVLGFVQIGLSPHKLNKRIRGIILRSIVPLGLGIILGGVCITFFLTKYFVSPLRHMADITLDIARGNLTRMIDIRSRDEIGQLSMNFNKMTKALKVSYDEKEKIMLQLRENVSNLFQTNEELVRANEQLKEAQERLVRSEKLAAVGKLASGVGHELRNPLGAIRSAVFVIRKKTTSAGALNDNQKYAELIEIIEKETERSIKIINDLLGFSRTAKPAVSPTTIGTVLESSFSRLRIPDKIRKVMQMEDSLPLISVDASQIEQVFVNLIQNACDAMPGGGVLSISAQREGEFLAVAFTDTGCGIPDNIKNKIFDPLFTTKPKGIGLGLAISSNIIQRHEGYIDLRSKEGEGTSFIVKLPIVKC